MTTYRRLQLPEKVRLAEVDRTERITEAYRQRGRDLEVMDVEWSVPPWSLQQILSAWDRFLQDECLLWGAFDGEVLVGFCGYRPDIAPGTAQFTLLHVSRLYRRLGIGRRLAGLLIAHAREQRVPTLYVTATPRDAARIGWN